MEISDKQNQKIAAIAKKFSLSLVLLFGSRVSGPLNQESDFDVAYLPKKPLDSEDEIQINYEFTNIFEGNKVKVISLEKTPPFFMKKIFDNHKILFCSDMQVYYSYRIYAFKIYVEFKEKMGCISNNLKT